MRGEVSIGDLANGAAALPLPKGLSISLLALPQSAGARQIRLALRLQLFTVTSMRNGEGPSPDVAPSQHNT